MNKVKALALSAILAALCVGLLYLAGIVPTVRLPLVALAALFPAVAVIQCTLPWGVGVYAASAILTLLLVPDKTAALWYALVLGHYGIFKSLIERMGKQGIEWILKILVFAASICAMYFLFRESFAAALPAYALWILLAVLLVCFVLYDIAFSALISLYCKRIMPHVK